MREFTEDNLDDLAVGAAILGTGGGGNPYVGKLLARAAIREHGPVTIVDVDEVPDDALVVPSAMMGAPTVIVEKLPSGEEAVRAFEALQDHLGRRITHTMPIEAGGLNSTIPFTVAARLGIPVVDADGMGRAFPEVQMVTATIYGIPATPMALADEKGNRVRDRPHGRQPLDGAASRARSPSTWARRRSSPSTRCQAGRPRRRWSPARCALATELGRARARDARAP